LLQNEVRGLTVRDRILLHLATYEIYETDHWSPTQVSQKGIAKAVGILQRHIPQYVRPMIKEGLVEVRSNYIQGGKQHQKVYFLTSKGRTAAIWMRNNEEEKPSDKVKNVPMLGRGTKSKPIGLGARKIRGTARRTESASISR
jgi:predicted transcriptional regulator